MAKTNIITFQQLACEALDGDADAALQLARRCPGDGFLPWLAKWVPVGEMDVDVFDRFSDAYHRMEMEREAADCDDKGKSG